MPTEVTLVNHPTHRMIRTVFQAAVSGASMAPLVYSAATHHDPAVASGWAALGLAIAGGVTRVMALQSVESFLERFAPFLAATPKGDRVVVTAPVVAP